MGRLAGKIAFITGAARGQGRSHAVRLAQEGADIIAVDVCGEATSIDYPAATAEDLKETVSQVEALGRKILAKEADVRDFDALKAVVAEGSALFGGVDVVVANAGVCNWSRFWEMPESQWQDVIDINLTGVFYTLKAAVPTMIEQGRGGSIVITSSVAGIKAIPAQAHYSAAKHGLVGLMKAAAIELAPFGIRVNTVHPWAVDTPMCQLSGAAQKMLADNPSYEASFGQLLTDPPMAKPEDISEAVLFLASPEARVVTGVQFPVDSGATKV